VRIRPGGDAVPSLGEMLDTLFRPRFWHNLLGMRSRTFSILLSLVLLAGWAAFDLAATASAGEPATITFGFDFPNSDPEHYTISVESSGNAKYECSAKISADSEQREDYQYEFNFSDPNRARIFDLASQAHYFAGKIDSGNHRLAFTGSKKLTYQDGQHTYTADYNYSNSPAVEQLTELFQKVAATLEYGRHLAYYHRYQKLALDEELKRMEIQAKSNELSEIQAVQPILQKIFDDSSVMNVVRARAQRLIESAKAAGSASR
jgi:hypothetical protein